jgi:hypothetical protein
VGIGSGASLNRVSLSPGAPCCPCGWRIALPPPRHWSSPLPEIGQRAIAHLVCVRHSHGQAVRSPFGWGFSQGLHRGNPTLAPCPGSSGYGTPLCPRAVNSPVCPCTTPLGLGKGHPLQYHAFGPWEKAPAPVPRLRALGKSTRLWDSR